jgi:hypothetical protein
VIDPETQPNTDDPVGWLIALEAAALAASNLCPHCKPYHRVIPMPGNGWGVDVNHQPGCPHNTDNDPPAVLHIGVDGQVLRNDMLG